MGGDVAVEFGVAGGVGRWELGGGDRAGWGGDDPVEVGGGEAADFVVGHDFAVFDGEGGAEVEEFAGTLGASDTFHFYGWGVGGGGRRGG